MKVCDRRLCGFVTGEAVLIGVESCTSSLVRIPRDPESLESPDVRGLYFCGKVAATHQA